MQNNSNSTQLYEKESNQVKVLPGANDVDQYLPMIKNKSVALVVNQTSLINNTHLLDSLIKLDVKVKKVFAPEHGFRGTADAGETISNNIDSKTGIPVISLYGSKKAPTSEDLQGIDIVIFDIQDVGVRFYTYLSTLHYILESCSNQNVSVIVLDRPNPNIGYIDGPVLNKDFSSFVGLHPVPVVYGMSIGEYAQMIIGESWINTLNTTHLTVIPCLNYSRSTSYILPVKPSPNLPNNNAIEHYPSLCFFEPTDISIGRGTDYPFELIGHPGLDQLSYSFTPRSVEGAKNPKHLDITCYGINLKNIRAKSSTLDISWLIKFYALSKDYKFQFFKNERFFDLLAGNDILRNQIINGIGEDEIRISWQNDINDFLKIRSKYLIYKD